LTGMLLARSAAGSVHRSFKDAALSPKPRAGIVAALAVSRAPGDG